MTGTLHVLPLNTASESRIRAHATATAGDVILLGMPHLAIGGISETWLLKELGHRHWHLLARAAGRSVPDFRDLDGRDVYAAFNAVSLRDLDLTAARENDRLEILSGLGRLSRTQFRSVHKLYLGESPIGSVELISVFVKRTVTGRNRSIVRVDIAGLPPIAPSEDAARLANDAAAVRSDAWTTHMGFARVDARPLFRHEINPCPAQDFNGAGFLYCATFQAFVDRAEWEFWHEANLPPSTVRREIIFRGNIEVGERVAVCLVSVKETEDGFKHWCRVRRVEDDQILADVFTHRVFSQNRGRG